jgi:hypothetical protein
VCLLPMGVDCDGLQDTAWLWAAHVVRVCCGRQALSPSVWTHLHTSNQSMRQWLSWKRPAVGAVPFRLSNPLQQWVILCAAWLLGAHKALPDNALVHDVAPLHKHIIGCALIA